MEDKSKKAEVGRKGLSCGGGGGILGPERKRELKSQPVLMTGTGMKTKGFASQRFCCGFCTCSCWFSLKRLVGEATIMGSVTPSWDCTSRALGPEHCPAH